MRSRRKGDVMKNRKINENLILHIEMMVLIMISLIAVTIAWFVLTNRAQVNGMRLQAGSSEYIKVALEEGGPDVLELVEDEKYIDVGMPVFANTKAGQMAPGTYGEMKLYVTALSPIAKGCSIRVEHIAEYVESVVDDSLDGGAGNQSNIITKSEIDKLLKGHIQLYSQCTEDGNGKKVYTGLITEEEPFIVPLEKDVEKEVTVYWVWPYEYTDLPQESLDKYVADKEHFFDEDKYEIDIDEAGEYTQKDYISFYDYGDTKLGMNVKDVHFHIYVDGLQYERIISNS